MVSVRKDSGFTLVELMIVVAIIALLAGLAAPKVKAAVDSSRQTKVAHDLKVIQDALERHYQERGYYPVKLNKLKDEGFLKAGFNFRVPTSGYFYFYAVDDNLSPTSPRAYILGAPGKDAGPNFKLYHHLPLPRGIDVTDTAFSWKWHQPNKWLWLYAADDVDSLTTVPLDTLPNWLGLYRSACQQPTEAEPCDVYTN